MASFDLVVVGAGIVGLAHALAAIERGLRVAVVERDASASQASVRNFGFVTVSGQAAGATRERALRSRETWARVAEPARIAIHQRGAVVLAQRGEAMALLREFANGPMGGRCELWNRGEARARMPMLAKDVAGALSSPHELRVDATEALPRLAAWLESRGVVFHRARTAFSFERGRLAHSGGALDAGGAVFAVGNAAASLFPGIAGRAHLRTCKLQMLRIAPPGWQLPAVVMSDLSLIRYEGFASLSAAGALRARLEAECAEPLARGIHLIVAQHGDGSLTVGDSHAYGETEDAFGDAETDTLILAELRGLLRVGEARVVRRWNGYYPVADTQPLLRESLGERARLVVVTSGTGMSTAFAIGEETIAELFP